MTTTTAITAINLLVELDRRDIQIAIKGNRLSLRPASSVSPDLIEAVRVCKDDLLIMFAEPRRRWREQALALVGTCSAPALSEDLLHLFDEREAIASVDGDLDDDHAGQLAYQTLLNHIREKN